MPIDRPAPQPSPACGRGSNAASSPPYPGYATARGGLLAGLLAGSGALAHAAEAPLAAHETEPRAYGYFVGDVVTRHIDIDAAAPLSLDEESLPSAARQGQALELRELHWQRSASGTGSRYALTLQYQVFLAPRELRTLEMPPLKLRFNGLPRAQELRIEAWPVTVAPLVPLEASPRHGLGEMRPDVPPPTIATGAARWRLFAYAGVAALLLAYLAQVYLALPWWSRRRRPFALAWARVRALSPQCSPEQLRAAMQGLHRALNDTAGRVVFDHGLEAFVAGQPRFAPLKDELRAFFGASQHLFFGGGREADVDATTIVALCRRCRDIERGAA